MSIEVNSTSAVCSKCGKSYSRRKSFFPVSYSILYKGVGYTSICRDCVDALYNQYLSQCNNSKDAVRQVCRKLDLYWSEKAFESVKLKSTTRSMMTKYMTKINTITYVGKCYDDTLSEEGNLWGFISYNKPEELETLKVSNPQDEISISEEVTAFWGPGYSPAMYMDLEQRRKYWMSRLPKDIEIDIGTEAIIKQLCSLEIDINRDRAAGLPVDKNINTLNTLLGSANLKPIQKKSDDSDATIDNTPFGVWIRKWENQKPIPESDPELKDVDKIIKYISVWFLGHLCKMLGIKNTYCKLYEDEINKMRVEKPEYEGDDDEELFNDIFNNDEEDKSQL